MVTANNTHTHTHAADQFPPSCAAAVTFALHSREISQNTAPYNTFRPYLYW